MAENGSLLSADLGYSRSSQIVPQKKEQRFGIRMKVMLIFLVAISIGMITLAIMTPLKSQHNGEPVKIRILLPPEEPFTIYNGQNRVLDIVFYSGNDDRMSDDFKLVTKRQVLWSVSPKGVVELDQYGTLQALNEGNVKVTVQSLHNPTIFDEKVLKIVSKKSNTFDQNISHIKKIDYKGVPIPVNKVLQKIVSFFTKQKALNLDELPKSLKDYINNPQQAEVKKQIIQKQSILWKIMPYADGSDRTYIKRVNPNQKNQRDKQMILIGNRYLPGDGENVISIQDDNALGIWTVNLAGQVSRIEMREISHRQKARIMTKNTEKYVQRHGLSSDSIFDGQKWVGSISDNDGLWTSMFAAGQLMRYASLKRSKATKQEIYEARESALKPLKAVLLTANVACRNKTIDAKIRHYANSYTYNGAFLSSQFLLKNKSYSTESYPGSPADGVGYFGIQAGTYNQNNYIGGKKKYTFLPFNQKDWSNDSKLSAATTKRTLEGFWARTFTIKSVDKDPGSGLFFQHNKDGTQTVLSNADVLYDYTKNQHPTLDLGNKQLPEVLKSILMINETQYNKTDLIYKGDTSTDEVIGHLFLYKIAFDILSNDDPEEKALKDLIRSTMIRFCTMLTNNGYNFVDATGQGTKWGKISRQFLMSDFTLQDSPIQALQLLLCFKLCYYVTGNQRWQKEYDFLINDKSFRYMDLISLFWKRNLYFNYNIDYKHQIGFNHLNHTIDYSDQQIIRHFMHSFHYSDDQEGLLAFYLIFQLEDKKQYHSRLREGLQGFWVSISRSQNPLWYLIYQLCYPDQSIKDYFGNNIVDVAAWQLSRTSIDTRRTAAFVEGSRNDVIIEGKSQLKQLSLNPDKIIGKRKQKEDSGAINRTINYQIKANYDPMNIYDNKVLPADERSIHKFNAATFESIYSSSPNTMEAATIFTLPYWLGVYHNMIELD